MVVDVLRYLSTPARGGSWNMALDEALMESGRRGRITLRVYGWTPPCLSLGRNQIARGRYDSDEAARRGIDIVRRPTGGRAVLHDREITYSVTGPAGLWGGLREGYLRINRGLARGLLALGVKLDPQPDGSAPPPQRAPPPTERACFRDPLPGELASEGRKLVGSAQWRADGALLQHGSILLHDDQRLVDELLAEPKRRSVVSGACSLQELMGRVPPSREISQALAEGLAEELGARLEADEVSSAERRAAAALEARYTHPGWTWRR
jgi:lipoate-protein ligase A